mgnify:CR=1 FL=1
MATNPSLIPTVASLVTLLEMFSREHPDLPLRFSPHYVTSNRVIPGTLTINTTTLHRWWLVPILADELRSEILGALDRIKPTSGVDTRIWLNDRKLIHGIRPSWEPLIKQKCAELTTVELKFGKS